MISDYIDNFELSYSLSEDDANKLLKLAPLKRSTVNKLYLEIIKKNGLHLNLNEINVNFLANLCSIDGALILDDTFNILSFGEIIDVTEDNEHGVYGTGTNACKIASKKALAIKISEDGDIKAYLRGEELLSL